MQLTKSALAFLGLATSSLVAANPIINPSAAIKSAECLAVNLVVKALSTYGSATPFCSSFLSIPTITLTATSTISQPTTLTITTTTGTNTVTAPVVTVTETAETTITTCIVSGVDKRNVQKQQQTTTSTSTSLSKATALPSCVAAFASSQISTACSCLAIPTPSTTTTTPITVTPTSTSISSVAATTTSTSTTTTTVTSTSTVVSCPTPSQCGNQGLQWAEYTNSQGKNSDSTYSNFDPTVYKTEDPNVSGVTSSVGGIDDPGNTEIYLYGSSTAVYSDYFALNHRGYLFAQVTGTYTFTVSSVDDTVFVWVGPDAYSGWSRANTLLFASYSGGPGAGTATIDLVEGSYYPLRIMFAQAQGGAVFQLSVAAPDGTVFLDSSSSDSPYLVQYSCDGVLAPQYSPFGSET